MITTIKTEKEFIKLITESQEHPHILLKHSTRCAISAASWRMLQRFAKANPEISISRMLVIECPELSSLITEFVGSHESPQIILFKNGETNWCCGHGRINEREISRRLKRSN